MIKRARGWAREIKRDLVAIATAVHDPRTPRPARWLGVAVIAYAASPIDLIPDFIPVIGLLDDVLIVPLGLLLVRRMIPPAVLAEHRELAASRPIRLRSMAGAMLVVAVWVVVVGAVLVRVVW